MKRCRRPLILITLLLLGGAVVNVAVAWMAIARAKGGPTRTALMTEWMMPVPDDWDSPLSFTRRSGVGWREDHQVRRSANPTPHAFQCEAGWPLLALRSRRLTLVGLDIVRELGAPPRASRLVEPIPLPWWESGVDVPSSIGGARLFDLTRGRLPVRPLWCSFLLNTLFYTAILALPLSFFPIRRRLRARRGRCPKCGYDLAGLAEPAAPCPECGATR